ncbi:MAG: peptidoglycan binding domain-containing protein [Nocardioidaceae bacterium]
MRLWPRRKVFIDDLPKTHDLRFATIFVIGFALLCGALYAVGYFVAGDRVPAGTKVAGIDVGGMRPDKARTVLQEELAPRLERPFKVSVAGREFTLDPQVAGLTFDLDATLDEALGGSAWDPRHMLHVLMGGDAIEPVVDTSESELSTSLARIAHRVERRAVDSKVSFSSGQPTATFGQAGRALDFQGSGDRLAAALVAGDDTVTLPVKAVQPKITAIEATRFIDTTARRALSQPIRIRAADATMTLVPGQFGRALRAVAGDAGLRLDIDADVLMERSRPALQKLPHHPVNARILFKGGHPVVVPGLSGVTVSKDNLAKAVLRAVARNGVDRHTTVKTEPDDPNTTTQEMRMLRINERVSSKAIHYTADTKGGDPTIMIGQLDGALLRPGDMFSFISRVDGVSSPATASLVASVTYDAALSAGLATPERSANRTYSSEFTLGRDAHVEPPATDLVLGNESPYGVYVRAFVSPGKAGSGVVHVEIWSTRYWRLSSQTSARYNIVKPQVVHDGSRDCVPRQGVPGFEVDVTRTAKSEGRQRTETTHSRYSPRDAVVCN